MVDARKNFILNQPQPRVMLFSVIYFVATLTVRQLCGQFSCSGPEYKLFQYQPQARVFLLAAIYFVAALTVRKL